MVINSIPGNLGYCKLCSVEDFSNPELKRIIRDVFAHEADLFPPDYPQDVADSKQWDIAMAVRTLRDHGALTADSRVLGVGVGTDLSTFYLTRHVREVIAVDLYAAPEVRRDSAPLAFLQNPGKFSPIPFNRSRLLPLHMDPRLLHFEDNTFDAVYSSGGFDHGGSPMYLANVVHEIGRVLRPGGVASIVLDFKIAGPPNGDGWEPGVLLLSADKIRKYVVEASGLELIGSLDTNVSEQTLSVRRNLDSFLTGDDSQPASARRVASFPNLVVYHEGYLFASVHLALRKRRDPAYYDNSWAATPQSARREIESVDFSVLGVGETLLALLRTQQMANDVEHVKWLQERVGVLDREWHDMNAEATRLSNEVDVLRAEALRLRDVESRLTSNLNEAHSLNRDLEARLAKSAHDASARFERLETNLRALEQARDAADRAYNDVQHSWSWRITAPLRTAAGWFMSR